LFEGEDNITTPPRREALREQLYYELIGRGVPGDKNEWVERINNVFRGDEQLLVTSRITSVEINNQSASESTVDCVTDEMQNIKVTRLPKDTIVRLIMNGTDEFGDEDSKLDETSSDDLDDADDDQSEASETSDDDEEPDTSEHAGEVIETNESDGEFNSATPLNTPRM